MGKKCSAVAYFVHWHTMDCAQLINARRGLQAGLVLFFAIPCLVLQCAAIEYSREDRYFTIQNDTFIKDGKPLQIISGRYVTPVLHCITSLHAVWLTQCPLACCSFHYYRIPPAYWEDRLLRAKALGLNTIQVKSIPRPRKTAAISTCLLSKHPQGSWMFITCRHMCPGTCMSPRQERTIGKGLQI